MLKLPEIYIRSQLGEAALVIDVDMTHVHRQALNLRKQHRLTFIEQLTALPTFVRRGLQRMVWEMTSPFLDDGDITPVPIEESTTYRRMADVWEHRDTLAQSETYDEISQALSREGRFRHKSYEIESPDQIAGLIKACYLDIMHSMDAEGYRSDRRSDFATGGIGRRRRRFDTLRQFVGRSTDRMAAFV